MFSGLFCCLIHGQAIRPCLSICPMRALLERTLTAAWQRRGPLAMALWPLSRLYGALAQWQRARAVPQRLPVPVIVIGNVVAGGAGKTPTTLAVVRHLQSRGWRPGIVSRGHGRASRACLPVQPGSPPRDVGDEPLLLRRRAGVPVQVATRRADAGRALLAANPAVNVLVCDDGLQHQALARDVEICVFDGRGTGNGWLLPAGPLREPWPRPAHLALFTEGRIAPDIALPCPAFAATRQLADHAIAADGRAVPLRALQGRPVVALAAIARPQAFFDMLRARGLTLAATLPLPDHAPLARLPPLAAQHASLPLLCTEKDAAKLWPLAPQALAVPLELRVPAAFFAALNALLPAPPGQDVSDA